MTEIADPAAFEQRLDQLRANAPDELTGLVRGIITGDPVGAVETQKALQEAKERALLFAAKQTARAIAEQEQRARDAAIIPIEVEAIVTDPPADWGGLLKAELAGAGLT